MLRSPRALTFGYGCAVHVGVDVGAGDAEVDVIYITFIMSTQYTRYMVLYKVRYNWTIGQLTLCVQVLGSDRGVLNPFTCGVTNIYRYGLLRICDDATSLLTSSHPPYLSNRQHFKFTDHKSCDLPVLNVVLKELQIFHQKSLLYSDH